MKADEKEIGNICWAYSAAVADLYYSSRLKPRLFILCRSAGACMDRAKKAVAGSAGGRKLLMMLIRPDGPFPCHFFFSLSLSLFYFFAFLFASNWLEPAKRMMKKMRMEKASRADRSKKEKRDTLYTTVLNTLRPIRLSTESSVLATIAAYI